MLSFHRIAEIEAAGRSAVLVSVVAASGSSPRHAGARMLVFADGSIEGTVGGGALELTACTRARGVLAAGRGELVELDLARDLGMACGGRTTLFFEVLGRMPTLLLFGAGHVALVTARLAHEMGFRVIVVDDRPELANPQRFPHAAAIVHDLTAEALDRLPFGRATHVVIATYAHDLDERMMRFALGKPARFIGLMGSRRKAAAIKRRCLDDGFSQALLDRVQVPVGLDIGAETPEEIALSIVGELVRVRRQGEARAEVAALVAAAGDSERMGFPKALLRFEGEALVHRVARTVIQAGAQPCVVTVPGGDVGVQIRAALADLEVVIVDNDRPEQGLIGSVRTALDLVAASAAALVVAPVDAPFASAGLVTEIVDAVAAPDAIAVASHGDRLGHPVAFGREHFESLRGARCDQGAAALIGEAGDKLRRCDSDDARILCNLNGPDDAAAFDIEIPRR